jgi:hypothetical protein
VTIAKAFALAAALAALSGTALACPNVPRDMKVANSDVVVRGVVDCPVGATACSLRTERILKAEPSVLRKTLRQDDLSLLVAFIDPQSDEIDCTLYWQAYAGRYRGTFYLRHKEGATFWAAYWPDAREVGR